MKSPNQPLFKKCIVITRPVEQRDSFRLRLEEKGAEVLDFPTIEIHKMPSPEDHEKLVFAIKNLAAYRWLVFTSANGVECFFSAFSESKYDAGYLRKMRIAVIGKETAKVLESFGYQANLCPEDYRAEGLLQALRQSDEAALRKGARVLIPRAKKAREVLPDGLRALGANVDVIPVYETVVSQVSIEPILLRLREKTIDCITFTSSSTVEFFFEKFLGYDMNNLLNGVAMACIGPVTAETLKNYKMEPTIVSKIYHTESLAQAIEGYFEK